MKLLFFLLAFSVFIFLLLYLQASFPILYYEEVVSFSKKYGFEPALVFALIRVESGFDPNAVSPAGAVGLLQVMPSTYKWLREKYGIEGDLTDPASNIEIGLFYLKYLLERYGDLEEALMAYNVGPYAHEEGVYKPAAVRYLKKMKRAYVVYKLLYDLK